MTYDCFPGTESTLLQDKRDSVHLENQKQQQFETSTGKATPAEYKCRPVDVPMFDAQLSLDKCLEENIGNLWFSMEDSTAVKLHKIIDNGVLPKDHILYKLLSNIISFVDLMSSGNRTDIAKWKWDDDVKGFILSIRKVGGEKNTAIIERSW